MSASGWRAIMTYNKYSQVAARAVRSALKEPERIKAEKRATVTLKKQIWEGGNPSESKFVDPEQQRQAELLTQKKSVGAA